MIFIKLLSKFIKVLSSAASPNQLAWGFALGAIMGLTPFLCLHNLAVIVLLIILNVNVTAATFSLAVFSLIAYIFDPLFHGIGYHVLVNIPALKPTWTSLYNAPIAPFTRFNNTIVMGSVILALILLLPNYFLFKLFVKHYRETWNEKVKQWKVTKAITGSKIVQLYLQIKDIGG
jgi:uncharacterized protein (TIGR03546 family)